MKMERKENLLDLVIETAIDTVVEHARKQDEMLGEISCSDDVLFKRDEMNEAWNAIEKVEKSKSIQEIHKVMSRYVGKILADKVIKIRA